MNNNNQNNFANAPSEQEWICSKCGEQNSIRLKQCKNCYTKQPRLWWCPKCHAVNTKDNKFCHICRNKRPVILANDLAISIIPFLLVLLIAIQIIDAKQSNNMSVHSSSETSDPLALTEVENKELNNTPTYDKRRIKWTFETKSRPEDYQKTTRYLYGFDEELISEHITIKTGGISYDSYTFFDYYPDGTLQSKKVDIPAVESERVHYEGHYDRYGHLMDAERYRDSNDRYLGVDLDRYNDIENVEKVYDRNGNLIRFGAYSYEYDSQGRIHRVTNTDGIDIIDQEALFSYDTDGSYTISRQEGNLQEIESYNIDGNLTKVVFLENGILRSYPYGIENSYNGKEILSSSVLSAGEEIGRYEYQYEKTQGRTEHIDVYYYDHGQKRFLYESTEFIYNPDQELKTERHTWYDPNPAAEPRWTEIEYYY